MVRAGAPGIPHPREALPSTSPILDSSASIILRTDSCISRTCEGRGQCHQGLSGLRLWSEPWPRARVPTCQEPCRDPSHWGSPVTSQLTRGGRGDSTRCFYSRTLFRLWRVTVPAPGTGITGPRTQPRQWKDQMTRELWGRARAPRPWFKQRGQEKRGSRCGPGCRTGRTAQLLEPSGRGTHRSFCLLFLLQNVGGCAFPLLFQLPNSRETQGTRERVASREQQSPALDPRPANSL